MPIPIHQVDKNLEASQKDGNWAAATAGLTSSYITPFALALGASHSTIGFLASFPDLINSSSQLLASWILRICRSRRTIVYGLVLAQAAAWLSFLLVPLAGASKITLLITLVALNGILGGLIYPIWNSLMGDIVPSNRRGYFFARRTRLIGLCSFLAMIAAGSFLAAWSAGAVWAFASLFAAAGAARYMSARYLAAMSDVPLDRSRQADLTVSAFAKKLTSSSTFGRFVLYASAMKFAVSIANPFFAVYMLQELKLTYLQFTIIAAAPVIGRFLFTPLWGRFVDSHGNKVVLTVTGICSPVVPFLWLLSQELPYLFLVELFSGFVWSGFDLSSSNYIFDAVKARNRVKAVGYYNFLVGIGIFFGATLGTFLLLRIPAIPLLHGSAFLAIIAASCGARLLVTGTLLWRVREARLIAVPMRKGFFPLMVRPSESLDYSFIDIAVPDPLPASEEGPLPAPKKQQVPAWAHSEVGRAIISMNRENGKTTYGQSDAEILELIQKGRLRLPSTLQSTRKQRALNPQSTMHLNSR